MNALWILFGLGCLWILGVLLWGAKQGATEGFQTAPPWALHAMDRAARQTHSCRVLEQFPDTELPNTQIEIVEDTCEDGMPHTSDANTIRIPAAVWGISQARRDNVLRHERVHILQRRDPEAWRRFYKTEWEYTLHTDPPARLPEQIRTQVRGNPDTWPAPWACWRGRYWFLPTYTDAQAPRLRNAEVRVWDAETGDWCPPPLAWRAQFCRGGGDVCPHQWEHPHEMSAEMWTDMSDWQGTPAGNQLKQFMVSQR